MKALIKGTEVYKEKDWQSINPDGTPLTRANLNYALCEDCPDLDGLTEDDFDIAYRDVEVPDEYDYDSEGNPVPTSEPRRFATFSQTKYDANHPAQENAETSAFAPTFE